MRECKDSYACQIVLEWTNGANVFCKGSRNIVEKFLGDCHVWEADGRFYSLIAR